MAMELELKLMVQPNYLKSVCDFINQQLAGNTLQGARRPTLTLMNGYYDTADAKLLNAGIALRIRAVNQQYIQTVKTRGSSRIGMHERGEWEWQLPSDSLDLNLVAQLPLPDELKDMAWSRELIEVFRTDFERQVWDVSFGDSAIEMVCDQGEVSSPYGQDGISELELELKQGSAEDLYGLAAFLAEHLPVQVSVVSKAQKGARLRHRKIELPAKPAAHSDLLSFAAYWYEAWLVYWEAMYYLKDEAFLHPVRHALTQLAQCLPEVLKAQLHDLDKSYGEILPSTPSRLLEELAALTNTGKMMVTTGRWLNQQTS